MKAASALLTGTLIGSALLVDGLHAAEWQREAGITLGAYLSDNICLSDSDKKAWGAGTATPDIHVRGQGARANLYLDAEVEVNSLGGYDPGCARGLGGQGRNRESVIPRLRYLGDLELVKDWLTLQSDAFVGSNPIDPFAAGGTDSINGRNNINITYEYGAGALVQRRLFDSADLRMRYYHSQQHNKVNQLGDSSEDRGLFDLGTERGSNRFSMGVAGHYSKVKNESTRRRPAFDNTLSSAEIRAALKLSSKWQIDGRAGEEWNDFISARSEIDGSFWDAGLRWTPNDRVEVAAGTGKRFFGTTPRGSIRYRHKRSELTASYARSLTFPRDLRTADDGVDGQFDPGPDTGPDPDFDRLPGDPLTARGEPTFIGNIPIINERFSLRYRYSGSRTTLTIAASDSRQVRTEDLAEATFSEIRTTFSRSLTSTLTGNAHLSWSEREGEGGDVGLFGQHSKTWRAGVGLSRRLGSDTTVSVGYRHTRQESDFAANRYNENRLTLSIRHQF